MFDGLFQKYRTLPIAAKSTIWFTICNFLIAGMGFITAPIFTRLISPEEYGVLTLFVSYEQLIIILATWELYLGAYQKGLFKFCNDQRNFTVSTLSLINIITIICFILVFIFHKAISEFTQMTSSTLGLLFLYLMLIPAYQCWIVRKRTAYDYGHAVPVTLIYAALNILIPFLAVVYIGATATVKFNATLLISSVIAVVFYLGNLPLRNLSLSITKIQWSFLLVFQAPLVLHALSYLVLGQADRVMIGKMVGSSQAAYYGVAYTLASAVTILQTSLNQALTPWRFQKLQECRYDIIRTSTEALLILMGGLILLFVLIAPEIMQILFTVDYYEAVWCIPPVSTGVYFMFLYSVFVNIESFYEQTKYIMYVSLLCGLLSIGANFVFIPLFGYISCGYTTLFSYILFAVFHYLCMQRICRREVPNVHIFSTTHIITISMIVVLLSLLFTLMYPIVWLRYLTALLLCIISYTKREYILPILAELKLNRTL